MIMKNLNPRSFVFKRNPFFHVLSEVMPPTTLAPSVRTNSATKNVSLKFCLGIEEAHLLSESRTRNQDGVRIPRRNGFPRDLADNEVFLHLKFSLLDYEGKNETLPYNLSVELNDIMCPLPASSNSANGERRRNQVIELTDYVRKAPVVINQLNISWLQEPRKIYGVTVHLVLHLEPEDLVKNISCRYLSPTVTRQMIIRQLCDNDDDEITTTTMKASLLCPLGKKRMVTPCRAISCSHIQCFDCLAFLKLNEQKDTFTCPVCDKPIKFEEIHVDGLFSEILASTGMNCIEIQFSDEGRWSIINNRKITIRKTDSRTHTKVRGQMKRRHVELIDIASSDSDESDSSVILSPRKKRKSLSASTFESSSATHMKKPATTCQVKTGKVVSNQKDKPFAIVNVFNHSAPRKLHFTPHIVTGTIKTSSRCKEMKSLSNPKFQKVVIPKFKDTEQSFFLANHANDLSCNLMAHGISPPNLFNDMKKSKHAPMPPLIVPDLTENARSSSGRSRWLNMCNEQPQPSVTAYDDVNKSKIKPARPMPPLILPKFTDTIFLSANDHSIKSINDQQQRSSSTAYGNVQRSKEKLAPMPPLILPKFTDNISFSAHSNGMKFVNGEQQESSIVYDNMRNSKEKLAPMPPLILPDFTGSIASSAPRNHEIKINDEQQESPCNLSMKKMQNDWVYSSASTNHDNQCQRNGLKNVESLPAAPSSFFPVQVNQSVKKDIFYAEQSNSNNLEKLETGLPSQVKASAYNFLKTSPDVIHLENKPEAGSSGHPNNSVMMASAKKQHKDYIPKSVIHNQAHVSVAHVKGHVPVASASPLHQFQSPDVRTSSQYPPMPPLSALPALLHSSSVGFSTPPVSGIYPPSGSESPYFYSPVIQTRCQPPLPFFSYGLPCYAQPLPFGGYFDGHVQGLSNIYSFVSPAAVFAQNWQNIYGNSLLGSGQNYGARPLESPTSRETSAN